MTIKHGTDRRYSDGCRCDECREAHKLKARTFVVPCAAAPVLLADAFELLAPDVVGVQLLKKLSKRGHLASVIYVLRAVVSGCRVNALR